jgi:2-methylaconitate cis-trans-isomerase PrpF
VPGSIPNQLARSAGAEAIRIAHPSGVVLVDAAVEGHEDGGVTALHGAVYRTARRLFEGFVYYRPQA